MPGIVIINKHEPEGEVATRLLELAEKKGYAAAVVEAQRGEHDASLSFRVPQDVADAFEKDRDDHWPAPDEVSPEDNPNTPPVRQATAAPEDDTNTPPSRTARPGKAEKSKE